MRPRWIEQTTSWCSRATSRNGQRQQDPGPVRLGVLDGWGEAELLEHGDEPVDRLGRVEPGEGRRLVDDVATPGPAHLLGRGRRGLAGRADVAGEERGEEAVAVVAGSHRLLIGRDRAVQQPGTTGTVAFIGDAFDQTGFLEDTEMGPEGVDVQVDPLGEFSGDEVRLVAQHIEEPCADLAGQRPVDAQLRRHVAVVLAHEVTVSLADDQRLLEDPVHARRAGRQAGRRDRPGR
jgi:hypothetical protein